MSQPPLGPPPQSSSLFYPPQQSQYNPPPTYQGVPQNESNHQSNIQAQPQPITPKHISPNGYAPPTNYSSPYSNNTAQQEFSPPQTNYNPSLANGVQSSPPVYGNQQSFAPPTMPPPPFQSQQQAAYGSAPPPIFPQSKPLAHTGSFGDSNITGVGVDCGDGRTYAPVGISNRPPPLSVSLGNYSPNSRPPSYPPPGGSRLPPPLGLNGPPTGHHMPNLAVQHPVSYPDNTDHYKTSPHYANDDSPMTPSAASRAAARIDPRQMPRPLPPAFDVVFHTRSGSGRRNPPSCNSIYNAIDTGNCTPRHMRVTMSAPPCTKEVLQQTSLPFAVLATPFANPENGELELPFVNMNELVGLSNSVQPDALTGTLTQSPPRCSRCRGYINPSVSFSDGGNKWTCNLCNMANQVPAWYYCGLDGAGLRHDRLMRPELQCGSVDFLVGKDYCVRPAQEPIFVFAIDISERSLGNGATTAALRAVRSAVDMLRQTEIHNEANHAVEALNVSNIDMGVSGRQPFSSYNNAAPSSNKLHSDNKSGNSSSSREIKIGIITFSDKIQFYSVNNRPHAPDPVKISIVDSEDPFAALPPSEWLYSVDRQYAFIDTLLTRLPSLMLALQAPTDANGYHTSSGDDDPVTCPTAAVKAVQSSLEKVGGRLMLFTGAHSGVGYGRIPNWREGISNYKNSTELTLYCAAADVVAANVNNVATSITSSVTNAAASLVGSNAAKPTVQQSQQEELKALCDLYTELATDCVRSVLSVTVFAILGENVNSVPFFDAALLSEPVTATGGRLHLVLGDMTREEHQSRLSLQVTADIGSLRGSESVMKLRTSIGIRPEKYIGQGVFSEVRDEVSFNSLDANTSVMFTLKHDSALKDEEKVHLQLAVLYTNNLCQRVVRVHNITHISSNKPTVVYRNSDIEAVVVAMTKASMSASLHYVLNDDKKGPRYTLYNKTLDILHTYRISCSINSPRAQLILPESLKVLPIYTLGVLKHPALLQNTVTGLTPNTSSASLKPKSPSSGSFHLNNTPRSNKESRDTSSANLSAMGSSTNLSSMGFSNSSVCGKLVKFVGVRAIERAYEIRKLLNVPVTDVINALYPRMYSLYSLFDNDAVLDSLATSEDSVGDCYDDYYTGNKPDSTQPSSAVSTPSHSFQRGSSLRNVFGSSSMSSMGEHCVTNKEHLRLLNTITPSSEQFDAHQVYLLDDKSSIWLYIGRNVTQEQIEELFKVDRSSPYDRPESAQFNLSSDMGRKTANLVEVLRSMSTYKQDLRIIWADARNPDNPTMHTRFAARLVEDSIQGNNSYVDFLCNMHKKIQDRLPER